MATGVGMVMATDVVKVMLQRSVSSVFLCYFGLQDPRAHRHHEGGGPDAWGYFLGHTLHTEGIAMLGATAAHGQAYMQGGTGIGQGAGAEKGALTSAV